MVLAIVGPRQAGKTTFLQYLHSKFQREGKSVRFLTFERRSDLALFDESLESYLLKESRSLLRLATETELIRLTKCLATQVGQLVSYGELSNTCGLAYKKLLRHLEILRQTYIVDLLPPFFTNRRTELTKNPKVYFLDPGLRNMTIADFLPLLERNDLGAVVENVVFGGLRRMVPALGGLHFWRTKSKAEVDFVLRKHGAVLPIEVKYRNDPPMGKSLHSFIEKFSPKEVWILTRGTSKVIPIKTCQVRLIPVYYLP